jgi:hypothetical protein
MFAPGEAEIASVSGCGFKAARDGRHDVLSLSGSGRDPLQDAWYADGPAAA